MPVSETTTNTVNKITEKGFTSHSGVSLSLDDIAELKEKVGDTKEFKYLKIDEKLLKRYLVAHKNVTEAYKRLVATNTWRKEYEVASITSDTPGVKNCIALRVATVLDVYDQKGRPTIYIAARNHNFRNRNIEDMTQFIVYLLETSVKKCKEDGLDNVCLLFDLKDFSMTCMDYPVIKAIFDIVTGYYPERLGVALVLNAPFIFSFCWAIIRGWLDERTASKVRFVKDEQLSEFINPSALPEDIYE